MSARYFLVQKNFQKVLSQIPEEEGFSLIELVVVVAVLAILAAIALPSFTSINDKARVSGAKSTLANMVKECAVKLVGEDSSATALAYKKPSIDRFNFASTGTDQVCGSTDVYSATPKTNINLPTFRVSAASGSKTCTPASSGDNKSLGCTGGSAGTLNEDSGQIEGATSGGW